MDETIVIKIAICQYGITLLTDWTVFVSKITAVIENAKKEKAQLLVLPEYAGIEVFNKDLNDDLQLFENIQPFVARYLELFQQLAKDYQLYIQPGSIPVESKPKVFRNRAYFFSPSGKYGFQDKINRVSSERENALIEQANQQTLFETDLGLIGIAVCYDSEFPELVRNFTHLGAKLILVPSFTPSKQSFLRIFYSCQARALENQCFIAMSSAIGQTKLGDTLYTLEGHAHLFTPVDTGFTSGRFGTDKPNEPALLVADLNFEKIEEVRKNGQVLNFADYMQMRTTNNTLKTQQLD